MSQEPINKAVDKVAKKGKEKIPSTVRNAVWYNFFGNKSNGNAHAVA